MLFTFVCRGEEHVVHYRRHRQYVFMTCCWSNIGIAMMCSVSFQANQTVSDLWSPVVAACWCWHQEALHFALECTHIVHISFNVKTTISINSDYRLIFVMDMECVLCEVGAKHLCNVYVYKYSIDERQSSKVSSNTLTSLRSLWKECFQSDE